MIRTELTGQIGVGDLAPRFVGATASGRFYSLDAQAGRPAMILALGALSPADARGAYEAIAPARAALRPEGIDVVPIAPMSPAFAAAFADPAARDDLIHIAEAGGLESLSIDGRPGVLALDRSGRIVDAFGLEADDLCGQARRLAGRWRADPPDLCVSTAPVLIIPNIADEAFCRRVIDHFEASQHRLGAMASVADGRATDKLDTSLKFRRDIELTPELPLHGEVLTLLARRCVPEIKRAFQKDVGYADRVLVARYDDTGGYFRRHRDNALPHTAFREFAVSLNLNTHEYEGGELSFPEFDAKRYSPPAGGAIVFSASLLHEALPVLKGSRYVVLTFLSSSPAP